MDGDSTWEGRGREAGTQRLRAGRDLKLCTYLELGLGRPLVGPRLT